MKEIISLRKIGDIAVFSLISAFLVGSEVNHAPKTQFAPTGPHVQLASSQKPAAPHDATSSQSLDVDFEGNGHKELVLAYEVRGDDARLDSYLVVYKQLDSSWAEVFKDEFDGAAVSIEELSNCSTKEAILVKSQYSGAGTITSWYVLASVNGQLAKSSPEKLKRGVLTQYGYTDMGYNSLTVEMGIIKETQPGYSYNQPRCCPDKPQIHVEYKFDGKALTLGAVTFGK